MSLGKRVLRFDIIEPGHQCLRRIYHRAAVRKCNMSSTERLEAITALLIRLDFNSSVQVAEATPTVTVTSRSICV